MSQYTNFDFDLSLIQIWACMGCQTPKSKADNGIMFHFQWYYFKKHVPANYFMLYVFSTKEHKGPLTKKQQYPDDTFRSYFEPNWAWSEDLSTVKFWGKDFTQNTHYMQCINHSDIFFLQKSVNCLTNIILWELVMFLLHTHIIHATLEHIKLVENRPNLHGETMRINAGETSAGLC